MTTEEFGPTNAMRLIEERRESLVPRMSIRSAAKRAGISDTRWRQFKDGYQSTKAGKVAVVPPLDTLARMAWAVVLWPADLDAAGESELASRLVEYLQYQAAERLRASRPQDSGPAAGEPPSPSGLSDGELIAELARRLAERGRSAREHQAQEPRSEAASAEHGGAAGDGPTAIEDDTPSVEVVRARVAERMEASAVSPRDDPAQGQGPGPTPSARARPPSRPGL